MEVTRYNYARRSTALTSLLKPSAANFLVIYQSFSFYLDSPITFANIILACLFITMCMHVNVFCMCVYAHMLCVLVSFCCSSMYGTL